MLRKMLKICLFYSFVYGEAYFCLHETSTLQMNQTRLTFMRRLFLFVVHFYVKLIKQIFVIVCYLIIKYFVSKNVK